MTFGQIFLASLAAIFGISLIIVSLMMLFAKNDPYEDDLGNGY